MIYVLISPWLSLLAHFRLEISMLMLLAHRVHPFLLHWSGEEHCPMWYSVSLPHWILFFNAVSCHHVLCRRPSAGDIPQGPEMRRTQVCTTLTWRLYQLEFISNLTVVASSAGMVLLIWIVLPLSAEFSFSVWAFLNQPDQKCLLVHWSSCQIINDGGIWFSSVCHENAWKQYVDVLVLTTTAFEGLTDIEGSPTLIMTTFLEGLGLFSSP